MRLLAYEPYPNQAVVGELGVELVPLERVFTEADFVTLHLPASAETAKLVDARLLALMKPSAFLINTCRGPVVDETSLIVALKEGRLAGAGLDVFEHEPLPKDSPLLELENVIVTPHVAVASRAALAEWRVKPFEEAARVLRGEWPRGHINRSLRG